MEYDSDTVDFMPDAKADIVLKDEAFRRRKVLIEKNAESNKSAYTVEFI